MAEFLDENVPTNADLLNIIQRHDEPYALWQQQQHRLSYSQTRADELLVAIDDWELFAAFLLIDNATAGKSRDPLRWYFQELVPKKPCRWTTADVEEM
ncbi:MAG: hypothetical protein QM775_33645 [Pirellulales bacterium]